MPELRWFEAALPRDTSLSEVTALVRVLANRPHYGLRRLQPVVVFELWLHPDRVRWLVGIEVSIARQLPGELVAQLPGLVLTPVDEPERPQPVTARDIRFTSLTYPLRLDTAQGVTTGLLHARKDLRKGEAVCVQFVVGPSHRYQRLPIQQTPLDLLGITTPREPDAGERNAFKQKLTEPLLGVRGRIGAVAAEPRWAGSLLRPVLSALSLVNGAQARLTASQQSSRTAAQLIQVMGRARTWSGTLNATELASLIGWNIGGSDAPDLPSGFDPPPGGLLAATTSAAPATAERLAGISTHPATRGSVVRLPLSSYAAHVHVIAPSGSGKSTLLAGWVVAEAAANRSLIVIEPKGDLVADILARLPQHRHGDLVVVDPGADATLPVVGFNPLAGSPADAERRADSLLHLFRELFGTAIGPRSADVLLHCLIIAARLPDGTLTDVLPILTNPTFRRWAVGKVGDPLVISPWVAWFDGLSDGERAQVVAPIANKVRIFSSRPAVRRLLGQSAPKFTLDSLFTMPRIVLVNLNAGAVGFETSKIIGGLVLSQLWEAIQRQTTKPERQRRPVSVFVDELQDYTAGLDFADVLARARGAKVPFTVAHQHLDQLSLNLRAAVLANARSRVAFRPAEGDARALAQVLGGVVTAENLERLPAFHAVARMLVNGAPSSAFEVATPPLRPPTADPDLLRHASSIRFGVDPAELDAAILTRWQGGDISPETPIGARRKRS